MRNITIAFATVLTLLSFGCKKKSEGGDSAAAMAKMSEFKDAMCKCSDAPCAQKVSDDMTKWSQEQSSKSTAAAKMSEADTKKAAEISEELGKCMQKAMTPPAAPADPAAAPADPNAAPTAAPADPNAAPAPAGGAAPAAPAAPAGETKPEAKK
jgi:hypothetical protein